MAQFLAKINVSLTRALKRKKKKLALTFIYCITGKLKNVSHNFEIF